MPETQLADAGAGLIVTRRFQHRFTPAEAGIPFGIALQIDYDDATRKHFVAGIHVSGEAQAITSEDLRAIPVARLLRSLVGRSIFLGHAGLFQMPSKELPRVLDDDALRKIAAVHRAFDLVGNRATQDVADHFGVGRTTAYGWIKRIEEEGIA